MYNPSDHIPLSKPLGAGRFPIDGKFMFFTNGAGGVYAYRPFVSLTEVKNYFPLSSDFRNGNFEILVNTGGTLASDGGSISGGTNSIYWWRDGVTDSDLILKTGSSTGGQVVPKDRTGADITDYAIDFSAETDLPNYPSVVVYVNGVSNLSLAQFNNTTKVLSALPLSPDMGDGSAGADIKIIFIG